MTVPFVPAPNTLAVEMIYNTAGGKAENVYHVQGTGPITDLPGLVAAMDAVFNSWESSVAAPNRAANITHVLTRIRDIGQQNGPVWEFTHNNPGAGPAASLPDNVTCAFKWTTGRGGRSYRGRTYHIGIEPGQTTGDTLTAGAATALTSMYNSLIGRVVAASWGTFGPTSGHLVVVSKRQGKSWLTTAVCTQITGVSLADTNLDSQRRRLKGRGT